MVDQGVKTFSWFIWRFNSPGMRSLMLHPGNPFRVQEAVTSLLAGDVFRDIGARSRFWLFKFFYVMFSLKHARESFRLWRLRVAIRTSPSPAAPRRSIPSPIPERGEQRSSIAQLRSPSLSASRPASTSRERRT